VTQIIIGRPAGEVITGVGLCAFVVWRHVPNLKRLFAGNETSLKTK
jgi:glycerol-3-phosphate acyltransferase PlsY